MRHHLAGFLILAAASAFAVAPGSLFAQGGFAGVADPQSLDTLSGSSTGAGTGQFALDRARGVANGPAADPFGGPAASDPFGGGGGDPFGGGQADFGASDEFGSASGILDPGAGGAEVQNFQMPTFKAIYGTRYTCKVTGEMLDDARQVSITAAGKEKYYDDGKTGMDAEANDLTFTNVRTDDTMISPEAHLVKTRLIRALEWSESRPANEFFNLTVASSEPLADVPNILTLEAERDDKMLVWARRFLRDFRVNPDAAGIDWKFSSTFMPPPPRVPGIDIPAGFVPIRDAEEAGLVPEGQGGGVGLNGAAAQQGLGNAFGTDNIQDNPAASSGYF